MIRFIRLKSSEIRVDSAKFGVGIDPERGIGRKLDSDIAELSGNILIATEIGIPAAIRIEDFGRDALRQHVLRRWERVHRRVAVDVDEARRDEEAGRIDLGRGCRTREISDAGNGSVHDGDICDRTRKSRAIDDGSMAKQQVNDC